MRTARLLFAALCCAITLLHGEAVTTATKAQILSHSEGLECPSGNCKKGIDIDTVINVFGRKEKTNGDVNAAVGEATPTAGGLPVAMEAENAAKEAEAAGTGMYVLTGTGEQQLKKFQATALKQAQIVKLDDMKRENYLRERTLKRNHEQSTKQEEMVKAMAQIRAKKEHKEKMRDLEEVEKQIFGLRQLMDTVYSRENNMHIAQQDAMRQEAETKKRVASARADEAARKQAEEQEKVRERTQEAAAKEESKKRGESDQRNAKVTNELGAGAGAGAGGAAGGNWVPKKNTKMPNVQVTKSSDKKWSYMFWIYVHAVNPKWSQIFHKGSERRQRGPAVWMHKGDSRLHVRSATSMGWNTGLNSPNLPLKKWTHVAISHQDHELKVYYDGKVVAERNIPPPIENDGPLWSSAPWYRPAAVEISDFQYEPKIVTAQDIQARISAKNYKPPLTKVPNPPEA